MWALWCAGCVIDWAWWAGLSQQEPNKAWVRVGALKLLHAAWEETQPPSSWTDTRPTGLHTGFLNVRAHRESQHSARWWGWSGLLTAQLLCRLVPATRSCRECIGTWPPWMYYNMLGLSYVFIVREVLA